MNSVFSHAQGEALPEPSRGHESLGEFHRKCDFKNKKSQHKDSPISMFRPQMLVSCIPGPHLHSLRIMFFFKLRRRRQLRRNRQLRGNLIFDKNLPPVVDCPSHEPLLLVLLLQALLPIRPLLLLPILILILILASTNTDTDIHTNANTSTITTVTMTIAIAIYSDHD